MMRLLYAALAGLAVTLSVATGAEDVAPRLPAKSELRCGWFENPTPANAWLTDRDGLWLVAAQGGHQAEGDWPQFSSKRWVRTNGHYGYGCACLRVVTDSAEQNVLHILSSWSKPLQTCRQDPALEEPANQR